MRSHLLHLDGDMTDAMLISEALAQSAGYGLLANTGFQHRMEGRHCLVRRDGPDVHVMNSDNARRINGEIISNGIPVDMIRRSFQQDAARLNDEAGRRLQQEHGDQH